MIGTVKRDVEFTVIACTNSIPDAPVTMTDLTGTEIQTGPTGLEMCVGDEFCLDLIFTDQNIGDSLTLTTNATLALPGATLTQTIIDRATVTRAIPAFVGIAGCWSHWQWHLSLRYTDHLQHLVPGTANGWQWHASSA